MTDYRGQREAPKPQAPVLTQEQVALVQRAMEKLVRVCQITGDHVALKAVREAAEGLK